MTNVTAAILCAQVDKVGELVEMRRKNARLYNSFLKGVKGIRLPIEEKWAKNVYWMYAIVVEDSFSVSRDELMKRLFEKGIQTRQFFMGMHEQPHLRKFADGKYPVTKYISKRGLYLPSSSHLKKEEIKYVCEAIKEISERNEI
jgi:perosamine synthetase